MTLEHENPANLTEKELAKKVIEGKEGRNKETAKESSEPTAKEIENIRKISGEAIAREYQKGKNLESIFIQETAKKFDIPPERVREATNLQKGNIDGVQKKREGVLEKFRDSAKILIASSLGFSAAAEALPVADVVKEAVVPSAITKASENVSNPVLEAAREKMTPETRKDAMRIGMNFPEEGGIGGRTESMAGDLAKQLEAQTKALERQMAESGAEEIVETPKEREERTDEARDEWEDQKAQENEELTNKQLREKKEVGEEREQEIHDRELGKAIQNEGQPLREKLDSELPRLKTPEQIAEFLGRLSKESSLEATVLWAKKSDGSIEILAANPAQERGSVRAEVNEKKLSDFLRENPDAQIFDDHTHPKKVVEWATGEETTWASPEKSIAPPSGGDILHESGGIQNDFPSETLSEGLDKVKKEITSRVVTQNGVWEFSSSQEGGDGNSSSRKEKASLEGSDYEEEAMRLEIGRDSDIQRFVNKWRDRENLVLKFTPFDKNGKLNPRRIIEAKDFLGWGDK